MRHSGADHNKTMVINGAIAPRDEIPGLTAPLMANAPPRTTAFANRTG